MTSNGGIPMFPYPTDYEAALGAARLSPEAREVARTIFASDPERDTESRAGNVALRIPNHRTGQVDALESRTLELAQWLALQRDPAQLWSVTQPSIGVTIRCDCRPRHAWPSTPDFFVLYPDRAYWIECRTEARIADLLSRHPGLYVPTGRPGEYECPSAAADAAERDLGYVVRTPRAFNPIETRNALYLLGLGDGKGLTDAA